MSTEHPARPAPASATYASYLALDELLAAQRPRSDEHDETLFIVVHQVFELWFKQLLHELAHLQEMLAAHRTAQALATVSRVLAILRVVITQLDVLETMTPLRFTAFRSRLDSASGFQSVQFREIEAVLGRRDRSVVEYYPDGGPERARLEAAMTRPSLFDSFLRYLAEAGYPVPEGSLDRDVSVPLEPSPALQRVLLGVYRDEGAGAQAAERLVDLDEIVQEWRYRHVKMVERTIGAKIGTGGSAGVAYLRETLFRPVFPDLWAVRSQL